MSAMPLDDGNLTFARCYESMATPGHFYFTLECRNSKKEGCYGDENDELEREHIKKFWDKIVLRCCIYYRRQNPKVRRK